MAVFSSFKHGRIFNLFNFKYLQNSSIFFLWPNRPNQAQAQAQAALLLMFLDHARLTTFGRTPLEE
jgi:hypothetical protein